VPLYYTAQQGVVIVRTGKCQPEAKHQNKESNGKANAEIRIHRESVHLVRHANLIVLCCVIEADF